MPVASKQIFGAANPAKRRCCCCKRREVILARSTAAGEVMLSCLREAATKIATMVCLSVKL